MKAKVTQFLRPNGRRVTREVEIPDELKEQYDLLHACNCELTCEQLMGGQAVHYITVIVPVSADFVTEITVAGDDEAAKEALCKMLKEFDKVKFDAWLADTIAMEGEPSGT